MKRISGYGPSVVVLMTTMVVLVAGPFAVRQMSYAHSRAQIIQASQRLAGATILEQMNQAYRDIATLVEPSVVHISTEHMVHQRPRPIDPVSWPRPHTVPGAPVVGNRQETSGDSRLNGRSKKIF